MYLEFKAERDADFMRAYMRVIGRYAGRACYLKKEVLICEAIMEPAERFYVSEEQAVRVVSRLMKGGKVVFKNRLKAKMYEDILSRVRKLDDGKTGMKELIVRVVYSQAPQFYLTPESAAILFYGLIRKQV